MPTYFGETTTSSNLDSHAVFTILNYTNDGGRFTCPGSGNQTLVELSAWVKSGGGTPGNIRMALFEAGTGTVNKIAEGTAEVTVSSTTLGWVGHLAATSITPNPTTLTGGTDYTIVLCGDANDVKMTFNAGGDQRFNTTDYTGGFPSSLNKAAMAGAGFRYIFRAGVESAVAPTDTLMPQIWM